MLFFSNWNWNNWNNRNRPVITNGASSIGHWHG